MQDFPIERARKRMTAAFVDGSVYPFLCAVQRTRTVLAYGVQVSGESTATRNRAVLPRAPCSFSGRTGLGKSTAFVPPEVFYGSPHRPEPVEPQSKNCTHPSSYWSNRSHVNVQRTAATSATGGLPLYYRICER
jgi:hypothetical protein